VPIATTTRNFFFLKKEAKTQLQETFLFEKEARNSLKKKQEFLRKKQELLKKKQELCC
jgi:hypothetical protein